ncbi:MAG: SUMF1/EgtB/PvdO family nonheme iron enzyme [Sphingobacteriales bacterium]|nr:SUMF1/EgtB/PvdO family nonheme iron enzyme [Sphingobacteriales bacterium]
MGIARSVTSFDKGGQGGFKYAGSNNLNEVAWYYDNSSNKTHPVGQKLPNELGLYDMSGNVWEWCQDWYDADYYKKSPTNNPTGPTSGSVRAAAVPSLLLEARHPRIATTLLVFG